MNQPVDFAAISKARKGQPVFDGFIMYFPDAMTAVAEFSRINNEKHNPGEPLHWSKHKSNDHANCIARHLKDIGPEWTERDPESGRLHAEALAWRAMALLQITIEAQRVGLTVQAYLAQLKAEAEAPVGFSKEELERIKEQQGRAGLRPGPTW